MHLGSPKSLQEVDGDPGASKPKTCRIFKKQPLQQADFVDPKAADLGNVSGFFEQLTKLNNSIDKEEEEIADEVQITEVVSGREIISERILIEDNEKPLIEEKLKSIISDEVVNVTPVLTAGSNAEDAEELPKAMEEEEVVEAVEEDHGEKPVL